MLGLGLQSSQEAYLHCFCGESESTDEKYIQPIGDRAVLPMLWFFVSCVFSGQN